MDSADSQSESEAYNATNRRRSSAGKNHQLARKPSLSSNLYRQAAVQSATAAHNQQQQLDHPNLPPAPPQSSSESTGTSVGSPSHRPTPPSSANSSISSRISASTSASATGASSSIQDTGSLPPSYKTTTTKSRNSTQFTRAPTLNYGSSEENADSESLIFTRTISAQSLPTPSSHSLYEHALHQLANDVNCQKEVALGKRIGFYRLGKELGSGNFSKVKLGVHVLTKEKVAVKIMEKSKMDNKAHKLFAREIENMEMTSHPNIIRLFECIETLSKAYLIMEYAGGGELYTYVHNAGKLSEEVAKPIFAQITSAIEHLHSKRIVHRDIKPENVIFSHCHGWVKIADFGFSCSYEEDTRLNTFCGSPPYAAPELFRDQNYEGIKVDIWAMGILLYFMLVGVTPFRGETVHDLKKCILEGIYTMPDYVSTFAQTIITRMLEMDSYKRANISEIKRAYWMKDTRFTESFSQLSLNPEEKDLETNSLEQRVWLRLTSYGIDNAKIKEAAGKGCRNPIIGTYRIILYELQSREGREGSSKESSLMLAEKERYMSAKMNQQSKTCAII